MTGEKTETRESERREQWVVRFRGRVHGVGFRFTTRQLAHAYPEVAGYVRNCPDGSVELVMEGPVDRMGQLLEAVRGAFANNITDVSVQSQPWTGAFERFEIRY
ncbi:MAG: acylphosphatase [Planctomycetota bacterium]|nr:MAG: acylphosphatase [Planctomycetota bacterium]